MTRPAIDSRFMNETSLEPLADRHVGRTGDEEQYGEQNEHQVQHGRYHAPFFVPIVHSAPIRAVF